MGSVEFLDDKFENEVNQIAVHLGLEKIGWIFTTINHDCFLTSDELRMAARF
jgi:nuclear protein localization family protein 4